VLEAEQQRPVQNAVSAAARRGRERRRQAPHPRGRPTAASTISITAAEASPVDEDDRSGQEHRAPRSRRSSSSQDEHQQD